MESTTTIVAAKPWWASRTLAVNALGLVILVVGIILDSASILALPPQALGYLGVLLAIANAMLRFATSQPLASGPHQTAEVKRLLLILVVLLAALVLAQPAAQTFAQTGFFSFGPTTKGNETHPAGYDGGMDWLYAGGGVAIGTKGDSPNLWGLRQDAEPTNTGFRDNTTLFRIGAVPLNKTGTKMFINQSDGEVANISYRIHIGQNGDDQASLYSSILLQTVDNRDPNKVPGPGLRISGRDGGELTFIYRRADGVLIEQIIAKAPS